jgi:ubiquinone biosynthesis monooxygenase Coq7
MARRARKPSISHGPSAGSTSWDRTAACSIRCGTPDRLRFGAVAGLAGDRWNLGFLSETERQVEQHLSSHLDRLPRDDARSRAVVAQMRTDEAGHAQMAEDQGAARLPLPVRAAMRLTAKVMTTTSYRI